MRAIDKEQRSPTRLCFICEKNHVLGRGAYVAATADAPMEDANYTCGDCDGTCAYCESTDGLMTEGIAKGLLCERCWSTEVPKWKTGSPQRRPWFKALTNPTKKNTRFVTTYASNLDGVVLKELSPDGRLNLALRVYCKRGRRLAGNSAVGRQKTKATRKEDEEVFRGVSKALLREISASRGADRFSFDLLTEAENQGRRMESNDLERIFLDKYQALERLTDNEEKVTELRVLDVSRSLAVAIASRTLGCVILKNRDARLPSYSEEPERFVERVIEISRAWLDHCDALRNLDASSGKPDKGGAKYRREIKRQEAEIREKREAAARKKPKRAPPRERS